MFTDEHDIERELRAALDVRPSAGFERRVLEAASERTQTRRLPWTWLAAAAAIVLTAGVWALSGGTTRPAPESVIARVDPPARIDPAMPGPGSPGAPVGTPLRPPARARATGPSRPVHASQRSPDPEVLVPANQLALIGAFAREINGGRVHLLEDADAEERLRLLIVPEMTVQPIALATQEAGVQAPGSKGLHQ